MQTTKLPLYVYDVLDLKNNNFESFFLSEIKKRVPFIVRGFDIGPCKEKWSASYLQKCGLNKSVKIHVSEEPSMDFINKNFCYKTLPFSELVKRASLNENTDYFISKNEYYYLRSLGDDVRKDVADINTDFPELSNDINFPPIFEKSSFFSSVFRIASAKLQLWTHYDIMDNVLIQIQGKKRAVLFSPASAEQMYLIGDKSAVINIDKPDIEKYPEFSHVNRYEAILEPGDILFIPALWFHNVVSLEFGVAVNVFWRHLDKNCYDGKDPYGNKDLILGSRALQTVDRALKLLEELPEEYKDFYMRRMRLKIASKLKSPD